jgi:SAM-dependent methyltransferase
MASASPASAARTPAQVYDRLFVPALFEAWGPVVTDAARVRRAEAVLDVACGTGALTRAVAERVGSEGRVAGLDASADMLSVARTKALPVEWHEGRAEALPFPEATFDAVVSQFGLMFFDDPARALAEMMRVLRRGGRIAVAVCDAVEHSPGYAALVGLLHRLFGQEIADAFRAPFALGDRDRLLALCDAAGIGDAAVRRHSGTVRFASIDALVAAERACVWTLGGLLDDAQFTRLRHAAQQTLGRFRSRDGAVVFDMPALIVTAARPQRQAMRC